MRKFLLDLCTRKELLYQTNNDCDLLRSKPLFAREFISLAILSGKPQQIEFTVFVHLKLSKSPGHEVQVHDRSKRTGRHQRRCEDASVPRLELELGARRLNVHD